MSLDVYLTLEGAETSLNVGSGIFIREDGQKREITRTEWDARFPDREPVVVGQPADSSEVYTANITHNLNRMAKEAGIYEHLWRPDEIGIEKARELIEPLTDGLARLQSDPDRFKEFNPPNGWGTYEGLVGFIRNYLHACETFPEAEVSVWR